MCSASLGSCYKKSSICVKLPIAVLASKYSTHLFNQRLKMHREDLAHMPDIHVAGQCTYLSFHLGLEPFLSCLKF